MARFNTVLIEQAARGRFYGHLASPVARTGVRVDPFELPARRGAAGHVLPSEAAGSIVRGGYAAAA